MKETRLRIRALVVGLVLVAVFCALTPYNNILLQNSPLAGGHFPLVSFGCLLFLVAVANPLLYHIRQSWRFHLHEVLLIWSMVTIATGIAYTGFFRTFIINITTPEWFSGSASHLGQVLLPVAPDALYPKDPKMIRELYNGLEGGLDMSWWTVLGHIPWHFWVLPLLWWGLFVLTLYMAMIGLMGIFTHQWIENEKMNFPLLRVPEILGEQSENRTLWSYFTHKYFLIGLSLPVLLHLLNGLHNYFPEIPQIPPIILAQPYIPREGLFSGYLKFKIYIFPAFVGFAFLTSNQISFSLWFMFLLGGLLPGLLQVFGWRLPAAALGTTFGPVLSQVEEMQMVGAYGVFFFFILWLARHHLKLVLGSVIRRAPPEGEAFHGLMSPQLGLYLFVAGFAGIALWLRFFGMDFGPAVLFLGVSFMLQLVAARLICQGGLPYFTVTVAPSDGFLAFMNTRIISPATLYMGLAVQKVAFLDMREAMMPSLFHSSKLSDGSHPVRRFLLGIVLAILVGLVVTFIAMLVLYYKYGISSLPDDWATETTRRVHENIVQLLTHPEGPKEWSIIFTIVGAVVMLAMVFGFHRFIWWPVHPIGYLTTYSSAMRILWFSYLIGWMCNVLVLRYGGVNSFKEFRRLFVGLVVGDMLMAIIWLIAGMFWSPSYHVLPL